jgi:hypothetical protein
MIPPDLRKIELTDGIRAESIHSTVERTKIIWLAREREREKESICRQ